MSQVYLIDLTTIQQFEDLSSNVKSERINNFIKKSQDLDLKLLLGHAFYYDLIAKCNVDGTLKDGTADSYNRLLNGCTYQDTHGHQIIYEGIAPALVYFVLARFIEADAIRYTATGPVLKSHENASAVSMADITKFAARYRSIANAHANEIEKFLWDNKADYPLWQFDARNKSARQPAARIRAIDKTTMNFPLENTDPLMLYNQCQ